MLLEALAGPRYPEPPLAGERIQAWEDAVGQVPDDPDLWTNLGDAYFHDGALAGVEEPLRRAGEALNRALALDTALNVEPMFHLLQIAGHGAGYCHAAAPDQPRSRGCARERLTSAAGGGGVGRQCDARRRSGGV